jgi:hypothetical protein
MFIVATLAFAWGLSLASYRWFAVHNGWPMGEWQAHRPGLPIAIGLFAVLFAMLFAFARGDSTALIVPLFGVLCALAWTALTRIGAQSALLLAPLAVLALLFLWITAAGQFDVRADRPALERSFQMPRAERPAILDPVRGIPTDRQRAPLPPTTPR